MRCRLRKEGEESRLLVYIANRPGIVNCVLLLLTSGAPGDKMWLVLILSAVILVIIYSLAIWQYGRKTFVLVADKTKTLGDTNKTWWHYPLLTQTNGQHCSKSFIRLQNQRRRLSFMNKLVQHCNAKGDSSTVKR